MIGLFFTQLWAKIWGYVIGAGAVIAFVLAVYVKGQEDQKSSALAKQNQQRVKDLQKAKVIHDEVSSMPEPDVDKSLGKFMRD